MADNTEVGYFGSTGPGSKALTPTGSGPIVQRNQLYIHVNNPDNYSITFQASVGNGFISSVAPPATGNGATAIRNPLSMGVVSFNMPPYTSINIWFKQTPDGVNTGNITLTNTTVNYYQPGVNLNTTYDDTIAPATDNLFTITYSVG